VVEHWRASPKVREASTSPRGDRVPWIVSPAMGRTAEHTGVDGDLPDIAKRAPLLQRLGGDYTI
jgi:hypothetical protein